MRFGNIYGKATVARTVETFFFADNRAIPFTDPPNNVDIIING